MRGRQDKSTATRTIEMMTILRNVKRNSVVVCSPTKCVVYFVAVLICVFVAGVTINIDILRSEVKYPNTPQHQAAPNVSFPIDTPSGTSGVSSNRPKIAVAITVTKDGPFVDGALVLGYAAKKFHSATKGFPSDFDVELIAFVTKKVTTTRVVLRKFGWKIFEKDLPVALSEIENKNYADRMKDSGCCGADEFLKLWAYTLTQYERVIHLDMDCIIFKNLDKLVRMDKELLYTGDYNMKGGSPVAPAQGGFLVIRPSLERFKEFQAIIRKGDHGPQGWGGSRIGNFWGGQTIQGIMPYFYHVVHNGDGQELNRCDYNNMVDNPYHKNTKRCIDGNETCEDCRLSDPEQAHTAHFTICQKPWTCVLNNNPNNMVNCKAFHKKWFELRDEFEKDLGINPSYRKLNSKYPESLGMCKGYGDDKYLPLPIDKITKPVA